MSEWTAKGGTLSHKNACKEFGIPIDKLFEALNLNNSVKSTLNA